MTEPAVSEKPRVSAGEKLSQILDKVDPKVLIAGAQQMNADTAVIKQAIVVLQGNLGVLNAKLDRILEWTQTHP